MRFPVDARLKDQTPIRLVLVGQADLTPLRQLYDRIVKEGTSYPHERPLTEEEFLEYWYRGKSTVAAYPDGASGHHDPIGAFYLKANWPGRARHVANAGFIVSPEWRQRGLGWLLGATMLNYARYLGYKSVIFNLVFSENRGARHLWTQLGFKELSTIPQAVRNNDGSYQDAVIMFQSLV